MFFGSSAIFRLLNQILKYNNLITNNNFTYFNEEKFTLNTARIIRVTFSLTESLKMSAKIGMTLNLQINK